MKRRTAVLLSFSVFPAAVRVVEVVVGGGTRWEGRGEGLPSVACMMKRFAPG